MARTLANEGNFEEAVRKLDIAISLRPDIKEYILAKADLLQSSLRFAEAEPLYREALRLDPAEARAGSNVMLCGTLAAEMAAHSRLSRQSLLELFNTMTTEQRSAAELMQIGKQLGSETNLLVPYWLNRLKGLPIPPDRPLEQRLTSDITGRLTLDLSGTDVMDLSPLMGMPLDRLILSGCERITDLGPLRGMPLRELMLGRMEYDHHLASYLRRKACQIVDLSPLEGMPLAKLDLDGTMITGLSALRGMPLKELQLSMTAISDLSALQGMPLTFFGGDAIPAVDFSPLAGAPLIDLSIQLSRVEDLSFLREMPLKNLLMNGCGKALGYQILSTLGKLETLWLRNDFFDLPPAELAAIAALRNHPTLRQISTPHEGEHFLNSATTPDKKQFWEGFDSGQHFRMALLKMAGGDTSRFRREGQTWFVNLEWLPVSDLTPLQAAPISTLLLTGCPVSDLSPLKGMPLETLYAGSSRISSLEPLRQLPLTRVFLDKCPPGLDLSPLTEIKTLQSLLLPPQPKNLEAIRNMAHLTYLSYICDPESTRAGETAAQFWSGQKPEALAREGNYKEAEEMVRGQLQAGSSRTEWLMLGSLVLAQGDIPSYQSFCRTVCKQLEKDDIVTAVKVCLLGPDSGVSPTDLDGWMERVTASKPHPGDAYFILLEGLHAYRAGRYADAVQLLTPMCKSERLPAWAAAATAITSMACHQDGKREDAKAWLLRAREAIQRSWPARRTKGRWYDWLMAHLLLREAEKVIGAPAPPVHSPAPN